MCTYLNAMKNMTSVNTAFCFGGAVTTMVPSSRVFNNLRSQITPPNCVENSLNTGLWHGCHTPCGKVNNADKGDRLLSLHIIICRYISCVITFILLSPASLRRLLCHVSEALAGHNRCLFSRFATVVHSVSRAPRALSATLRQYFHKILGTSLP